MRCALLVEHDPVACGQIAGLLKSLGYLVASTDNAQTVRFDLVLTYTTFNADDRRSFIGEITRLAPQAAVVLLLDDETHVPHYHAGRIAVLAKPVTLRGLRRVIEFGIDGNGAMPAYAIHPAPREERRSGGLRRARAR